MKEFIIIVLIGMMTLLGACEQAEDVEKVTVLTSSGYAPYEIVDTKGNLTGFDIELMEAIADEMGIVIEWSDVSFDGIIASIETGQAEIAIAGLSPTEDRKQQVDFCTVYYNAESGLTNVLIFDPAEVTVETLDDLDGLIVAAQTGTVQAGFLDNVKDEYNFTVELRTDNTAIVQEILTGNIDVLVVEHAISEEILNVNTNLATVGFESYLDDTSGNAIAITKGSAYLDQINTAIAILQEDGTIDALIAEWFE
ncbi:transporter substrate-binding domain-containing protein [Candidatus Xianfuyuplasma coldseepsis]|uniref:Amino acid ABC transporter substrate-binding protein n=1 Tax=Candidatus Xianfuyuplasma coldseepsis TaxID=2782163 RepID=A0A7L7KSY2_9MOLU|nr:transporter substrate-binding domain-containing protein [Xianfuyuplasma coldseepsis]QMS85054.1 amino acid ABC transporter substrate-binding protein [Xianfuyuplasma coldseepsis]